MGGDRNGQRAAQEVASALSGFLSYLPASAPSDRDLPALHTVIDKAIAEWLTAARERLETVASEEKLPGMATTLAAALMWRGVLAVWWLGDSRVYRLRDGKLERLTRDHSYVEETLQLNEDESLEHAQRSIVTRFLRPGKEAALDVAFLDWRDGDLVFAVSDGVSGACRSWELEAFIVYWLASDIAAEVLSSQILRYLGANLHDNASIALAMRGQPKPFGDAATAEITMLARHGLAPELLETLTSYPHDFAEWSARPAPPWRQTVSAEKNPHVLAQIAIDPTSDAICLACGKALAAGKPCPTHGTAHRHSGQYLEVLHPDGRLALHPLESPAVHLGRVTRPEGLLSEDEALTRHHATLRLSADRIEVEDLGSDNGTWLRLKRVALPADPWLAAGLQLRVGRHQIAIRSTARQPGGARAEQQIELLKPESSVSEQPDA
jgi:serine/threonine protein phosphatase PrpC